MTFSFPGSDPEQLETPLREAIEATAATAWPEEAVQRVKERAKQLSRLTTASCGDTTTEEAGADLHVQPPRRTRRSLTKRLAVVAALLAAAVVGVTLLDHADRHALAQVIENVKASGSLRVDTSWRFGRSPENKGRMYFEGSRLRVEQYDGVLVHVVDVSKRQALYLDTQQRIAQPAGFDEMIAQRFTSPIDQLRKANAKDAEDIGEEVYDGRVTRVFRLAKFELLGIKANTELLVWVDKSSELPVKIVIRDPDPKHQVAITLDNFVWNPKLDAELFSLTIPQGFKRGDVVQSPTPTIQNGKGEPKRSTVATDGIVSRDRVPSRIVWNSNDRITALIRDPESVPPLERKPQELRQWNVRTGELLWSKSVRGAGCLAGSADRKMLALVIGDEIQLRDATTGKVMRAWATDRHLISVAFSPNGATLAAGIGEWGPGGSPETGGVQFWNVEQGSLIQICGEEDAVTRFVIYSPDGKHLAVASDRSVKLLDASNGKLVRVFPGRSRAGFTPDGKSLACVGRAADKNAAAIDFFNLHDGSLVKKLTTTAGETASWLLCVSFSHDGRFLAAADWNKTVTIWNADSGAQQSITEYQGGVHAIAFAPDSERFVTGSEDELLRIWDIPSKLAPSKSDRP